MNNSAPVSTSFDVSIHSFNEGDGNFTVIAVSPEEAIRSVLGSNQAAPLIKTPGFELRCHRTIGQVIHSDVRLSRPDECNGASPMALTPAPQPLSRLEVMDAVRDVLRETINELRVRKTEKRKAKKAKVAK